MAKDAILNLGRQYSFRGFLSWISGEKFRILDAIAKKTAQDDQRADFDAAAEARYAHIVATGKTIPWQEMRGYLEDRLVRKEVTRPVARKLAH